MKPFIDKRVQKNIRNYMIATNTSEEVKKFSRQDRTRHQRELRRVRLAPAGLNLQLEFYAYDNKVALISSSIEGFSILLESQELAESVKSLFKFIWA